MNMVRIRHIMEMRRACKAPPLLPPKLRKESSEANDRRNAKEVLDINFRIQILAPEQFGCGFYCIHWYESIDGSCGPWNLITESEKLEVDEIYDLEEIFAIEFSFERLQWIKIELFEHGVEKIFRSEGIFTIAQVSASNFSLPMMGYSNVKLADFTIWSTIREKLPPMVMQIEAKNIANRFISANSGLYIEIKVDSDLQKKVIYRSEISRLPRILWRAFTIQTPDFVTENERSLEIVLISDDEKEGIIGHAEFQIEQVKSGEPICLFNEAYKQGRKPCGELRVLRFQTLKLFSFLDYLSSGTTLRFAFAIDFSSREPLTTSDYTQYANDVEFAVRRIGEAVEPFNPSDTFLAYGFGARIPPQQRESNNFCLSLDVEPTCHGVNGVIGAFTRCQQWVQPLGSAKFSQIIYHMARNSQSGQNRDSSYVVLFVITRGAIDDLKETVQAAIFSSKNPISIVFIGIGCDGLDEIERIGNAGKRLEYQGRKSERDNLQYVNATKTRLECDNLSEMSALFLERSLQQIPWQLAAFFTQNQIFPGKNEDETRCASSSVSGEDLGLVDEQLYDHRATTRTNSGEVVKKNHRGRLSRDMRSLTVDDSRF